MSTSGRLTRASRVSATRRISPCPGRKTRIEPLFARERVERDARDLVLDPGVRVAADIARRDRKGATLAFDQRRVSQERSHSRAVERRRHDEEAQVLAQGALRVEREGETKIGVERALVELVEQNGRHAFERGVIEDHAGKHALGHDLDAGALRHEARQPHAQADRLADFLSQSRGHARGGGAGGETARLDEDEALALRPGLVEERERDAGGLARAGRGDQHRA